MDALRRLFVYKKMEGLQRELADCKTYFKRKQLFDTHGEALVEALEKHVMLLQKWSTNLGVDADELEEETQQLLAAIEKDAGQP
jgi:hypothetical protein